MLTLSGTDVLQLLLVCNTLLFIGYLLWCKARWPLSMVLLVLVTQMGLQLFSADKFAWLNLALALCYGPLLLALVNSIAWQNKKSTQLHHWLLPWLLPLLLWWQPFLLSYVWPLVSLQLLCYVALVFGQMRLFHQVLSANYSDLQHLQLRWLQQLLIGFLILVLLDTCRMLLQPLEQAWLLQLDQHLSMLVNVGALLLVYLLIWRALQQQLQFPGLTQTETSQANTETDLSPAKPVDLLQVAALEQLMQDQKPYLRHDLTLQQLADLLQLPAKKLSMLINQHYQRNFNDFINQYRVEFACHLLKTAPSDEKLLSIQLDAGFASKSVFNLAFKKITGVSPSQYRRT